MFLATHFILKNPRKRVKKNCSRFLSQNKFKFANIKIRAIKNKTEIFILNVDVLFINIAKIINAQNSPGKKATITFIVINAM